MDEGRRSFAISARAGSAGGASVRAQDYERSCDVLRPCPSVSTLRYLLQRIKMTMATAARATESSMGNTHESLMGSRLVFIP